MSNTTVSKYDYGFDGLISLNNSLEGRSFFHLDIHGSVVSLTEPTGATRQSAVYDAWGKELDHTGLSANKLTFTGHELDEETGLIYAKARFYDPDTGRFLTQDILVGDPTLPRSLHRCAYAFSAPTRYIDPDGLFSWESFGRGAGKAMIGIAVVTVAGVVVAGIGGTGAVVIASALGASATTAATTGAVVSGSVYVAAVGYGGFQTGEKI